MTHNNAWFFISCNAETDCFLFPVLPDKVSYSDTIKNTSITVTSLGETTVIEDKGADTITFNSRFPAVRDQAVVVDTLYEPSYYRDKLEKWRDIKKPVHFVCWCALKVDSYFTIDSLSFTEEGGPIGELSFSIKLKKYVEPKIRKIEIKNNEAQITQEQKRVDNTVTPTTYKVVANDSLSKIAKNLLGDASRWKEIYELNKDIIKNPNKIYPNQVFKIPNK